MFAVVLDDLFEEENSLASALRDSGHESSAQSVTSDNDSVHTMNTADKVDFMDHGDVFYNTNLFPSSSIDDSDLLHDLAVSASVDLLADCEPLMQAGTTDSWNLQVLSEAGIQQPAERQIRLHADLAHHLSSSPQDLNDVPLLAKSDPVVSSSDSELVRMLTSALEDAGSVAEFFPPQLDTLNLETLQHVAGMSAAGGDFLACSSVSTANSELARQLSLSTNETSSVASVGRHHSQQKVALVQPTVAPPRTVKIDTSQLIVHHPPSTLGAGHVTTLGSHVTTLGSGHVAEQPVLALSAPSTQTAVLSAAVPVQPPPRQIVITTQAPVQTQHVPQISLQQLQQVITVVVVLNTENMWSKNKHILIHILLSEQHFNVLYFFCEKNIHFNVFSV